jgi:4-amino-4-deoxy-L-arabinose transferase-like glycosyltransferase
MIAVRKPHYTRGLSRSWLIVPLLILYLFGLGRVGFLGPDEPRYASIGRDMAHTGDWITPRLDGQPWFEKPPLLYWMVAAGRIAHLPDEQAARVPVALASVAFLIFFFQMMTREFSPGTATTATAILATSAGWLAYSSVAVTDLAMSATLAAAMLLALFETRRKQGYVAGALLGLSILAKGFVPVVLFAPMFLVARGKRLAMLAGCILVAAPWYVLCLVRNGPVFWHEFFWKQHVERFFTPALQHVQPFWYYIPILLAGMFPWTPLMALLVRGKTYNDVRVRFLTGWLIFALAFFSAARNKLPGYMLPLLPPLAIVLAFGLKNAGKQAKWWLAASTLLLLGLPAVMGALPDALLVGGTKAHLSFLPLPVPALLFVVAAAAVWWLSWRDRPVLAVLAAAGTIFFSVAYERWKVYPVLDQRVSVRGFWRANESQAAGACIDGVRREWEYGLNYYAGHALPQCDAAAHVRIVVKDGRLALAMPPVATVTSR